MYKKVLILGANGLIGNGITKYLITKKLNIYGVVRSKNKKFTNKIDFFYCENLKSKKSIIQIEKIIKKVKPNFLINCLGVTKHIKSQNNKLLNIHLPKNLLKYQKKFKFKFIHITTDCVFDGNNGNYKEDATMNANDDYGRSKASADKLLMNNSQVIILRTSTLGNEIKTKRGLLEWFLSCEKICYGFKNAYFSGLTTFELAKIIYKYIINKQLIKKGLYNLSGPRINKFNLLKIIKKIYKKNILIKPNYRLNIDRSLNANKFIKISKYKKLSWSKMLKEHKKFND